MTPATPPSGLSISPTSSRTSSWTIWPSEIPLSSAVRQDPLSARPPPQGRLLPEEQGPWGPVWPFLTGPARFISNLKLKFPTQ